MTTKKRAAKKKPAGELGHIAADLRPLAVSIEELTADPQNARTHDEPNIAATAASLGEFGQLKPIVVNRRNSQVVAGNGTLAAARGLGWKHLAVVWVEQDEAAQRGFSLADNRTAELAGWDLDILAVQIAELEAGTPDLAAALQLAELALAVEEPAGEGDSRGDAETQSQKEKGGAAEEPAPEHYNVIVECEGEDEQKAVYEQLQQEGRKCRLLTL